MGGEARRRFLIVKVGPIRCALHLESVRRILPSLSVIPVPGAQPQLLGLAQWGGEPLAVLDLGNLVGVGEEAVSREHVTVVVRVGVAPRRETLGLAVDEVLDVVKIADNEVAVTGLGLLMGEAAVGDEVVRVLDLGALGTER